MKNIKLIIDYYNKGLKWWQRLFLKFNSSLIYTYLFPSSRSFSKTVLIFIHYLENLKVHAKTEEEKEYIDKLQKEWAKYCTELDLKYWNIKGEDL